MLNPNFKSFSFYPESCAAPGAVANRGSLPLQRMVPPKSAGSDKNQSMLQGETASAGSSAEKGHAASYQASQVKNCACIQPCICCP